MVIARIGMDKSLKVKNELVENSNKVSFAADGSLLVDELIEGEEFTFKGKTIYVKEFIEGGI